MSRWQAPPSNVADCQLCSGLALSRQSSTKPVELAGLVVIDFPETERYKPRRGPRTYVSGELVAVNDYRPRAIEAGRCTIGEILDRNVYRPGDVQPGIIAWRKHFKQLSASSDELLDLRPFDTPNHRCRAAASSL